MHVFCHRPSEYATDLPTRKDGLAFAGHSRQAPTTPSSPTYIPHACLPHALTKTRKVSLWRLPTPDPNDEPLHEHVMGGERGFPLAPLGEPLAEFGGLKAAATAMLWSPPGGAASSQGGFVTLADGQMRRWSVGDGRRVWSLEFGVETETGGLLWVSNRRAGRGSRCVLISSRLFALSS